MILPIGDHPNPRGYWPIVTWAIIATNLVIALFLALPASYMPAQPGPLLSEYLRVIAPSLPPGAHRGLVASGISAWDLFLYDRGYKPGAPKLGDLLASLFLHAGVLHVAGNILFLWIYGDNVEHRLGHLRFLAAYLAAGVVATLAFAAFAWPSRIPLVGASGAISGVLGLYFVLFPRHQVKVLVLLFPFLVDTIYVNARWILAIYVLVDNLMPLVFGTSNGVAYGAHLGGFVAGAALAVAGRALGWRWARR